MMSGVKRYRGDQGRKSSRVSFVPKADLDGWAGDNR